MFDIKRRTDFVMLPFFAGLALLLYAKALTAYFAGDDFHLLWKLFNDGYYVAWGEKPEGFFRPLVVLSYWLDQRLWGYAPLGYHLTNILLHAVNAFLVVRLGSHLLKLAGIREEEGFRVPLLLGGLLFLVLAAHAESVSWIAGRTDVLATLFLLAALIAYARYLLDPRPAGIVWSLAAFAAALLSKENSVVLPLHFILLAALRASGGAEGKENRPRWRLVNVLAWILLLAYFLTRYLVLGTLVGGYGAAQHLHLMPGAMALNLVRAILRCLLPPAPSAWQPFLGVPMLAGIGLAVLGLFVLLWRFGFRSRTRGERWLLLCLALGFVLALLPTLTMETGLVTTRNERLLYFASVFSSLFIVLMLRRPAAPRALWLALTVVLIGSHACALYGVNFRWQHAGEISAGIVRSLQIEQPTVLLNVPDNYQGAYALRNAFPPTLLFFHALGALGQERRGDADAAMRRWKLRFDGYVANATWLQARFYRLQATLALLGSPELKRYRDEAENSRDAADPALAEWLRLLEGYGDIRNWQDEDKMARLGWQYAELTRTPEFVRMARTNPLYARLQATELIRKIHEGLSDFVGPAAQQAQMELKEKITAYNQARNEFEFKTVALYDLVTPQDRMALSAEGNQITLRLENPRAQFDFVYQNDGIEVLEQTPKRIVLRIREDLLVERKFIYYEQGALRELEWERSTSSPGVGHD